MFPNSGILELLSLDHSVNVLTETVCKVKRDLNKYAEFVLLLYIESQSRDDLSDYDEKIMLVKMLNILNDMKRLKMTEPLSFKHRMT